MIQDFSTVTEQPGTLVSAEAIDMALVRYAFGGAQGAGKSVLEVACGTGPGLGYLSGVARRLVAGDFTEAHARITRAHYGHRVPVVRFDALQMPFRKGSIDVVLLFEALYFLPSFDRFVQECHALLSAGGSLVIVTVNPEWKDFNPAPFSTRYLSAGELDRALRSGGFSVRLFGAFRAAAPGLKGRVLSLAKRLAVRFHLIPKTMKGKELLKRLAFGKLTPFPSELQPAPDLATVPEPLGPDAGSFKVIYAVATKDAR
jgi:SAM-dependent methyltransferase